MLNLIQVIMLLNIGGFVITVLWVDHVLRQSSLEEEVRDKVGRAILILGIIVLFLLMIILIKFDI